VLTKINSKVNACIGLKEINLIAASMTVPTIPSFINVWSGGINVFWCLEAAFYVAGKRNNWEQGRYYT
jgi:hypothetical protein